METVRLVYLNINKCCNYITHFAMHVRICGTLSAAAKSLLCIMLPLVILKRYGNTYLIFYMSKVLNLWHESTAKCFLVKRVIYSALQLCAAEANVTTLSSFLYSSN